MYLPEHKFIVDEVGNIEKTPNKLHTYIEIILRKPAYRDEFGESKYQDDIFQCTVWNQKIETLPYLVAGDKVEAVLNYQGRKQFDQNAGKYFYTKQFSIQTIKKI